jgi:hypothetical protein
MKAPKGVNACHQLCVGYHQSLVAVGNSSINLKLLPEGQRIVALHICDLGIIKVMLSC